MLPHTYMDVFSYIIWRGHFWHPIWIFATFWISPALWGFSPISPKSPFSPKSPVFQWAGTFSPFSLALWRFSQNLHFRPNRQSPRGRDVFRHHRQSLRGRDVFHYYRQPSVDFCQNRQFRQNRQSPSKGIVRGWRFFAIFAIFASACISGHKWKWRGILMVHFYYRFL